MLPELHYRSLPRELRVERKLRHVLAYVQAHDPDLRIRRSVERPGFYVLERKCRRAPAVNVGMRIASDMHVQARDGYIHVSLVSLGYMLHPWNIVRDLQEEGVDLWANGGADQVADELEYEEQWVRETRKRRRHDEGRAYYREQFDILGRLGNKDGTERSRFTNPGLPKGAEQAA